MKNIKNNSLIFSAVVGCASIILPLQDLVAQPSPAIPGKIQRTPEINADTGKSQTGSSRVNTSSVALPMVSPSTWNSRSVNVRDYGAQGDGKTDDTLAIQQALNSKKDVQIPLGEYVISDQLSINHAGQRITGGGTLIQTSINKNSIIIKSDNVTISALRFIGTGTASGDNLPESYGAAIVIDGGQNCTIRQCEVINCSSKSTGIGAGIWLTGAKNCIVERNKVQGCFHGINTDAWNGKLSQSNIISENIITDCAIGYNLDLQGRNATKNLGDTFIKNTVSNMSQNGIIVIDATQGFTIQENDVLNCAANGIALTQRSARGIVSENNIHKSGKIGIVLNGVRPGNVPNNIIISHNSIIDSYQDGIQTYTVEGITMNNNIVRGNGRNGIYGVASEYPRFVNINNNDIQSNGKNGITISDGSNIVISQNLIYENSTQERGAYSGLVISQKHISPKNLHVTHNMFHDSHQTRHESQRFAVDIQAESYVNLYVSFNHFGKGPASKINDPLGKTVQMFNSN